LSVSKQKQKRKGKVKGKRKPQRFSKVIFTRYGGNPNYKTPKELYAGLNAEFHFTMDPCPINSKPRKNGLTMKWGKRIFCNPPYHDPNIWVEKGLSEIKKGHTSLAVYLLKGDISTALFHDLVVPYASEIRAVRGRLKFLKEGKTQEGNSPFPSLVAVFQRGKKALHWKPDAEVKKDYQKRIKKFRTVLTSRKRKARLAGRKKIEPEAETKISEPEAVQDPKAG
jgi:DNA N-6-adenine-methyltransferase (Dam)